MIGLLFCLFINIVDFFILHKFLDSFSTGRRGSRYLRNSLLVLCTLTISQVNSYRNPNMNLTITCSLIYLYSLTFKYPRFYHLTLPMLYIGLGFVTEPIWLLMIRSMEGYVSSAAAYNISVILCELIRVLMSYAVCQGRSMRLPSFSPSFYLLMFMLPVSSVAAGCIAIRIAWIYDTPTGNRLCLAVILIILLSNAMTFTIFNKLGILTLESKRNTFLLHEAKAKEEYYLEVERNNRNVQEIKHNLKNRLLGALAEKGDCLSGELEQILWDLECSDKKIYTSNIIFNTILNSKLSTVCESMQIDTEISVLIPQRLNLEYSDVGILLGNLLDNAVEACAKIPPSERRIEVIINYKSHMLILKIRNSKENKPVAQGRSSKKSNWKHGFGTSSVKKTAEKYDGMVEFIDTGYWFEASVILYGIQDDVELTNVI